MFDKLNPGYHLSMLSSTLIDKTSLTI